MLTLPLALMLEGGPLWKNATSIEDYAVLYERKKNDLAEGKESAVDCGMVLTDKRAIYTT